MKAGDNMILYVFGMFTGGFIVFMFMALFIGRHHVDDDIYTPDIYRSQDDDWEL